VRHLKKVDHEDFGDPFESLLSRGGLSPEQKVAEENWHAQKRLFLDLNEARLASGRSNEEIARKLLWDTEKLNSVLDGQVDLSLSDVRELGYAVNAVISYRVVPDSSQRLDIPVNWDQFVAGIWKPMPKQSVNNGR